MKLLSFWKESGLNDEVVWRCMMIWVSWLPIIMVKVSFSGGLALYFKYNRYSDKEKNFYFKLI